MTVCPNCGFRHALNTFAPELIDIPMPNRERDIILRLQQAQGYIVPNDVLVDFLYGEDADGGPERAEQCVQSHICRIRRRIRPAGWDIVNVRPRGYQLVRSAP